MISEAEKRQLVEEKLEISNKQIYSLEIDAIIADKTEDPKLKERVQKMMADAMKRKNAIEEILQHMPRTEKKAAD
jgi:hypothetical protein